jgi:hypothetical protein
VVTSDGLPAAGQRSSRSTGAVAAAALGVVPSVSSASAQPRHAPSSAAVTDVRPASKPAVTPTVKQADKRVSRAGARVTQPDAAAVSGVPSSASRATARSTAAADAEPDAGDASDASDASSVVSAGSAASAHTADAALLEEVAEAEAALRDAAKVFTAAV